MNASKITLKIFDSKAALVTSQQSNLLASNNLLNIDMKKWLQVHIKSLQHGMMDKCKKL
jgi:hypothetical protein